LLNPKDKVSAEAVNTELVKANWEIGRHIIEFEQHGHERAEYGSDLLARLSKDLKLRFGKGFGRRNVLDMRRFYPAYPKWQAVPAKLSWTHFTVLLSLSIDTVRKFYENQSMKTGRNESLKDKLNKIFVSQYQLYLPDKNLLQNQVKAIMHKR
jgi:hypothetical protein